VLRELTEAVHSRQVSATELVKRALERIERFNGPLNAVVALRAEEALREAHDLDARLAAEAPAGASAASRAFDLPLAGIPFLVKDNMDLAGMRTTQGSLVLADVPPAVADSLTVARLRAAGAIPVGKTNVPEFCFEGFTDNRLYGTTRNPWAPDWSPGGSSGGSAAAMAAGMIPFATGTDGGGSVRIPAAFCGLYGLKPTNGLIARDPLPFWIDYSTDGPLGLEADDVGLLLSVMAGPSAGDPTALPAACLSGEWLPHKARDDRRAPLRPAIVYAVPRFVDWGELPDSVGQLFTTALHSLEADLGLSVELLEPSDVLPSGCGCQGAHNADEDWYLTASCEQAHFFGRAWLEANGDRLTHPFAAAMHQGLKVSLEDYLAARRRRFDYVRELDQLLDEGNVIVTPTMPSEGFSADGRQLGHEEAGTDAASYNTQPQNVTGHPALSVPAGLSPNGVPFGLQVTGPRFRDDLVLAIGEAWQEAHPARSVAPGYEKFWTP